MAEKRATFILRRLRSLGFSKVRLARTVLSVPSRSTFFLRRRRAFSTGSPFFSLISVKLSHFLSSDPESNADKARLVHGVGRTGYFCPRQVSIGNSPPLGCPRSRNQCPA